MARTANAHQQQQQQHDQAAPLAKLLEKKQTRGGGLRVGRVVSEVRNGREDGNPNQSRVSLLLQEDERRIQEDMIEMLTVKLAKKERENELFRVQQKSLDEMQASYESQLQQLQAESAKVKTELTVANQQLQRQLQLLQSQYERMKEESVARNAGAQETKRLREKDQLAFRVLDAERQSAIKQLKRDAQACNAERSVVETKLIAAMNQQQGFNAQIIQLEANNQQLEENLRAEQELRLQVEHRLTEATRSLDQEKRTRASLEEQLQRVMQERQALEDKHRLLSKSIKDASAKVADADKKLLELTKSEDHLGVQLAELKRENEELKAKRMQTGSQTKHLNFKIAALEKNCESAQRKLQDALDEVESARKCGREYQFRIKQLQEELVFLEKRKKAEPLATKSATTSSINPPTMTVVPLEVVPPTTVAGGATDSANASPVAVGPANNSDNADIPSWMKD